MATAADNQSALQSDLVELFSRINRAEVTLGPLHGVPFSVRDMVAVEGMRLTFGSYMFEHNVADHDAVAVRRLKGRAASQSA